VRRDVRGFVEDVLVPGDQVPVPGHDEVGLDEIGALEHGERV
jgi:hypothetical protein